MSTMVRCESRSLMRREKIRSMSWTWAISGIFQRDKHIRSKVR